MNTTKYNIIGVMSGTSLDGIDLAHIHLIYANNNWTFEIFSCETVAYDLNWLKKLKEAVHYSKEDLVILNENYTDLLGNTIRKFIEKNKLKNLDAVCSHGHTILHQPQNGFTLQIGNLPKISHLVNQKVICNFRVEDVALGGQGAPLVPIGDQLLFSKYDYCINLGGFSNISFEFQRERIAFDISPVNTVLNYYANQLDHDYDDKGQLARSGFVNKKLLQELNELDFYNQDFPKSLGVEFVHETILPIIETYSISVIDKLYTFTLHIAEQTQKVITKENSKILITGGGAYNDFLIECIQKNLPKATLVIPDKKILEYKEALIFALLGVLRLRNEVNCLKSVTGASKNHSSGYIYN